jgi:hypothetical protein
VDVTFLFPQKKNNQKKTRGCVFFFEVCSAWAASSGGQKDKATGSGYGRLVVV